MPIEVLFLAFASGVLIGLVLGLVGGGGSILAVPLIVYVVGVSSPHIAIGTAAIAVALNAAVGLIGHWREGAVKWRCASVFALAGMAGAVIGAELGKSFDGQRLLGLFGILMIVVGGAMLRKRTTLPQPDVRLTLDTASQLLPRIIPIGFAVGVLAGFFGIGGGFLIVPGLILATRMPLSYAIGTSLVVITALGATTAFSYAISGYVEWSLALVLVLGGIAGASLGVFLVRRLSRHKRLLETGFGIGVMIVGAYVIVRSTFS